uniref:Hydroxynitrile lyase n=1 Tax=Nedyopus tambanus tambanus TaxID=2024739 RepID=A0A2Z5XCR8_9MYRI|nr:hydroxynitrile lyase [Nedyopus tambanus tambanus]
MLFYVSILLVVTLTGAEEEPLTCDKLPKVPVPPLEDFIDSNPLQFAYVLTHTFDCTTRVYVRPGRLSPTQAATALDIQGSHVIANDFVGGPDNSAILTNCTTGEKTIWHFQYTNLNTPNGSSYCAYTCNGSAIAEYKCANNNNGTDPLQTQAVEVAKKVPNGDKIHYALDNCPQHHGCFAFY